MTPFEQAAARAYGRGMCCLIAGCSLEHIKREMRGASHYTVRGRVYQMDTAKNGIALRDRLAGATAVIVPWRDVMAHIWTLPERILSDARDVDHDAHHPPASTLEWHAPFAPQIRTDGERFAYRLWAQHVQARTAAVLNRAFPDADLEDNLDLFAAAGVAISPEG